MPRHPLAQLEVPSRVLKRAQYEAFEFELHDGALLVRNGSHPDPGNHEYLVTVTAGIPTHCDCPADAASEGACKHRVAVAIRSPVLEAATHAQLAADGSGTSEHPLSEEEYLTEKDTSHPEDAGDAPVDSEESSSDDVDEENLPCKCEDLTGNFPCWNCVLTGRRSLPDAEATHTAWRS